MLSNLCCKCGTYDCYVPLIAFGVGDNRLISVDSCIAAELCSLWRRGIETLGCCCGHGTGDGYIQVAPDHVDAMIVLGYEEIPEEVSPYGDVMGSWCFVPKTEFPEYRYIDDVLGGDAR